MEKVIKAGFAKVKVQPTENPSMYIPQKSRNQYIKLYYPNGVSLILPTDIDPVVLGRYIHAADHA